MGALVAGAVLVIGAGPAAAHAQLESSDPSPSSVVLQPPRQVVLHFGEPVEIDFGSIRVFGPGGARVDRGGTHHPDGDAHSVAIPLPSRLPDGTYVVAWRVVSADSHPVHGAFVFSVGAATATASATSLAHALQAARGSTAVGIVYGLVRFGVFVGLLVLVGALAVVGLVWRGAGQVRRVRRVLWAAWATVLVGSLAGLAVQGVYAASLPLTRALDPSLLDEVLHTRLGEVELLRVLLLAALVPVLLAVSGRSRSFGQGEMRAGWTYAGAAIGIALLLTPGLSGHASTSGIAAVGLALDVVHLAAAAVWIGGLVLLGVLLVPGMPADVPAPDPIDLARRVSPLFFGAVVAVVASGVVQSLRQVGSWYALWHTAYGRILVVKVCLVAVVVALGAVSRRLVVGRWTPDTAWVRGRAPAPVLVAESVSDPASPHDGVSAPAGVLTMAKPASATAPSTAAATGARPVLTTPTRHRLRLSVLAELVVASAVLVATALLVNAPPARQAAAQPFAQSFSVLGVQVNAVVDPARVGPGNQFHFYVLGRLGAPVAIPELDAAISLPAAGVGPIALPVVVAAPGHYRADDVDIPFAGTWTLKLTVRTSPIDEQELFATVPVH
ncbi:MAG TPA: copper resistance protein CopC [Acidimicrobiales bacterium]|nr:copper resistance protein CopC [Acidimicrobiales bacterium]